MSRIENIGPEFVHVVTEGVLSPVIIRAQLQRSDRCETVNLHIGHDPADEINDTGFGIHVVAARALAEAILRALEAKSV